MDGPRGAEFADLSTATIRAVAKGVLGVAFLQAIIVGICLLIAGMPWQACWQSRSDGGIARAVARH